MRVSYHQFYPKEIHQMIHTNNNTGYVIFISTFQLIGSNYVGQQRSNADATRTTPICLRQRNTLFPSVPKPVTT